MKKLLALFGLEMALLAALAVWSGDPALCVLAAAGGLAGIGLSALWRRRRHAAGVSRELHYLPGRHLFTTARGNYEKRYMCDSLARAFTGKSCEKVAVHIRVKKFPGGHPVYPVSRRAGYPCLCFTGEVMVHRLCGLGFAACPAFTGDREHAGMAWCLVTESLYSDVLRAGDGAPVHIGVFCTGVV